MGQLLRIGARNFASKKRAKCLIIFERQFSLTSINVIVFGVETINVRPKEYRNLNIGKLLHLPSEKSICLVLGNNFKIPILPKMQQAVRPR
jgi:hypothetical protein